MKMSINLYGSIGRYRFVMAQKVAFLLGNSVYVKWFGPVGVEPVNVEQFILSTSSTIAYLTELLRSKVLFAKM